VLVAVSVLEGEVIMLEDLPEAFGQYRASDVAD